MKFYKLLSIVLPFVYLVGCSHQSGGIAASTSPLNPRLSHKKYIDICDKISLFQSTNRCKLHTQRMITTLK